MARRGVAWRGVLDDDDGRPGVSWVGEGALLSVDPFRSWLSSSSCHLTLRVSRLTPHATDVARGRVRFSPHDSSRVRGVEFRGSRKEGRVACRKCVIQILRDSGQTEDRQTDRHKRNSAGYSSIPIMAGIYKNG